MRFYTVHQRWSGGDPDSDLKLVKEGFSWPAFLFGGLWALAHRMWIAGPLLIAGEAAIQAGLERVIADAEIETIIMLALHVVFGMVANDLRRRHLARRGFAEVAVVAGRRLDRAEARFLEEASRLKLGIIG